MPAVLLILYEKRLKGRRMRIKALGRIFFYRVIEKESKWSKVTSTFPCLKMDLKLGLQDPVQDFNHNITGSWFHAPGQGQLSFIKSLSYALMKVSVNFACCCNSSNNLVKKISVLNLILACGELLRHVHMINTSLNQFPQNICVSSNMKKKYNIVT